MTKTSLGGLNRLLSFDTTWTAQKTMKPKILIFLLVYSKPRECVYRTVAWQRFEVGVYIQTDINEISFT
jgi:hypothetical protein